VRICKFPGLITIKFEMYFEAEAKICMQAILRGINKKNGIFSQTLGCILELEETYWYRFSHQF